MAVLALIDEPLRSLLAGLPCPSFPSTPCSQAKPLNQCRVALVSTAGIHLRTDAPFLGVTGEYRAIPDDASPADVVMSHMSVNFDRSGFIADWNVGFPLGRLHEMRDAGEIGGTAATHYSFMGAADPSMMQPFVDEIAGRMREEGVDAVLLVPI